MGGAPFTDFRAGDGGSGDETGDRLHDEVALLELSLEADRILCDADDVVVRGKLRTELRTLWHSDVHDNRLHAARLMRRHLIILIG